jgi:hypothetical protein
MRSRRPLTRILATAAASLLVAACGSSSPSSSAASGAAVPSSQARPEQNAVALSGCMRSHGVSDFPDPGARGFKYELAPSTPHTPAFESAFAACRHFLPDNGATAQEQHTPAQIAAFVAFARCIRSHGFPTFPDPTSTGQLTHQMVAGAGIDLHQPGVLRAGDACVGVSRGFVTKSDVARFVAGQ